MNAPFPGRNLFARRPALLETWLHRGRHWLILDAVPDEEGKVLAVNSVSWQVKRVLFEEQDRLDPDAMPVTITLVQMHSLAGQGHIDVLEALARWYQKSNPICAVWYLVAVFRLDRTKFDALLDAVESLPRGADRSFLCDIPELDNRQKVGSWEDAIAKAEAAK